MLFVMTFGHCPSRLKSLDLLVAFVRQLAAEWGRGHVMENLPGNPSIHEDSSLEQNQLCTLTQ